MVDIGPEISTLSFCSKPTGKRRLATFARVNCAKRASPHQYRIYFNGIIGKIGKRTLLLRRILPPLDGTA
jgi:hypothetical protein